MAPIKKGTMSIGHMRSLDNGTWLRRVHPRVLVSDLPQWHPFFSISVWFSWCLSKQEITPPKHGPDSAGVTGRPKNRLRDCANVSLLDSLVQRGKMREEDFYIISQPYDSHS